MSDLDIRVVGGEAAEPVFAVVHAAFAARPPLDPPAEALSETVESIRAELDEYGGLLATRQGEPVGALLFVPLGRALKLRRVGVVPSAQLHGIAAHLIAAATEHALQQGYAGLSIIARADLPSTVRFWEHEGFVVTGRNGVNLTMLHLFPLTATVVDPEAARDLGARLATRLLAGDLLILTGDLGAGKTTMTQGIGRGLQVRGDITSPTFVIARVHPSLVGGPALVHVDAYRLGGIAELDDLDLDTSLDEAVTVVEWGEGVAEGLADERLEVRILRAVGDSVALDHDPRELRLQPVGARWLGALDAVLDGALP